MNYGFVIDNRKCIGCHACTTACKSEHEVPLGVNRTWVKYTETGAFPETKRHFQVTRCNHCANPPCVAICPTGAMFQRKDGIVEFDNEICIGCKACMQACPYDAIYIDPETDTAAKCNYCAHRIEVGLEPACVIVCPEHAILSGDLDDPSTEIAQAVREHKLTVRKPEQGTRPKLFYIDVEPASVVPMAAVQASAGLWSTMPEGGDWRKPFPGSVCGSDVSSESGNPTRGSSKCLEGQHVTRGLDVSSKNQAALSSDGTSEPLTYSDGTSEPRAEPRAEPRGLRTANMAGALMARETYNVPHKVPWHWPVPAYLVTKAISAGTFMVAGAGVSLGWFPSTPLFTTWASFLSLLFALITTVLLIADLSQPKRFYYMLVKPQWRSWLTKGAFVLIGFTTVAGLSWLSWILGWTGLAHALIWPGVVLGALTAVYTAFLFAQCEGRDLWQSKLLGPHLFVQAVMAGAAALLIAAVVGGLIPLSEIKSPLGQDRTGLWLSLLVAIGALLHLLGVILERASRHADNGRAGLDVMAVRYGRRGRLSDLTLGVVVLLPLAAIPREVSALGAIGLIGGVVTLAALFLYEWAFVMAPQEVPNN